MVKKFTIPFASQGDANDIPDALQVDGKVSFTQGFGYDYERPYDDPQAKDIAREDMNGLFKAITSAVGELQTLGASEWSSAISYPKGAIVYYEKDLYISQADDNQNKPPQNWVSITSIANDSLKKTANLSDLTDKTTARSNLGLGSSATLNKTDVLGASTSLVATQKLVNDTKINLDNSVRAVDNKADTAQSTANTAVTKADSAQSRADSAYNLANSKWSPQETIGNGRLMREGARGGVLSNILIQKNFSDSLPTMNSFVVGNSKGVDNFWKYARGFEVVDRLGEGGRIGILNDEVRHMYYNPVDKKYYWVTHLTDKNNQQIGVGQTWVDVTSQRVAGTTYVNNTGKPIVVNISFLRTHGFYVNGLLISKFRGVNDMNTMSVIVPNNSNYKVGDGNEVEVWTELR